MATNLPFVTFALNSTINPNTGNSPFQLLFGHSPRIPGWVDELPEQEPNEQVNALQHTLNKIWKLASVNKEAENKRMLRQQPSFKHREYKCNQLVKVFRVAKVLRILYIQLYINILN